MAWPVLVLGIYVCVLALLSLNGMHRAWMLWEWWRYRPPSAPQIPEDLPVVTVQLPVFNERYVVQRLIAACGALRYPKHLLQIQVLDDSTDDTTAIAKEAVDELVAKGIDAVLIRRDGRAGFKAGALAGGLLTAKGSLVAVFDADFVPDPGFLQALVPWFSRPEIGMVQARWGHLNAKDSWLTRAQATLLDGHFVIEHTARCGSSRWFNFNGTAGIWRKTAIEDGGGWQHDTLTEDLDLSYRAQLAGWRFLYLPDVVAPAELPPDMAGFKSQQHRWAKGSIQTARKLLLPIWRSSAPLPVKLEATAHLCANLNYPLVVVLTLLMPWSVAARMTVIPPEQQIWMLSLLRLDLVLFASVMLPFIAFYGAAAACAGGERPGVRLVRLPAVLAVGLGLAVSQSRAVAEGLFGPVGTFVRTPKTGGVRGAIYQAAGRGLVGVELSFAAYLLLACGYAIYQGYLASLPFLGLFTAGYSAVGLASLRRA